MGFQVAAAAVGVLSVGGAVWVGGKISANQRVWKPTGLLATAFVLVWVVGHIFTDWSKHLLVWREYFLFDIAPFFFCALLILTIYVRICPKPTMRLGVATIGAVVGVYAILHMGSGLFFHGVIDGLDDDRGLEPVLQTTGWSCGAAATATLLRLHGVPASERQVARLAFSSPLSGTDDRGMCRAIEILGASAGLETSLRGHVPCEDLEAMPLPCIVPYKLYTSVWHVAVLTCVEGDTVELEDPLMGQTRWTRADFVGKWTREVLQVHRGPDGLDG